MTLAYVVWTILLLALFAGAWYWQRSAQGYLERTERSRQRAEDLLKAAETLHAKTRKALDDYDERHGHTPDRLRLVPHADPEVRL